MPKFRCVSCWGPSPARRVKGLDGQTYMEAKAADGRWVLVKWRADWCLPCPLCHSDFIHKRLRMHFSGNMKHPQTMAEMPDDRRRQLRRKGGEKLCRIIKGVPCPGVLPRGQLVDDDEVALDDALDDDALDGLKGDGLRTPDSLQSREERGEPRFR